MVKAAKTLHQKLTEIVHEVSGVNMESELGGVFYLDFLGRQKVRKIAARFAQLMDEYDRLDPLPTRPDESTQCPSQEPSE